MGVGSRRLACMYVKGREAESLERIRQTQGDGFRRTVVRRSRSEISDAGRHIAEEAIDMSREDLRTYPTPAPEHCATCAFVAPCLASPRAESSNPF